MAKRQNQQTIGQALKEMLKTYHLDERVQEQEAVLKFKELFGGHIMGYIDKVVIKNGILHIKFNSASLRNELSYGKTKIIESINTELKKEIVKDIKFY